MDEMESPKHSLVTWIIVFGIILVLVASVSGYIIANPESIYRLFGKTAPLPQPVAEVNGVPDVVIKEKTPHTKHYSNIFFEFDYPEEFIVIDELVNATRTPAGEKIDLFGSAEVVLVATSSDSSYTLRVTSSVNEEHKSIDQSAIDAQNTFSTRSDRGPNDSYQDITAGGRAAYKEYASNFIFLGIPTENLNYSSEILWSNSKGNENKANAYINVIEDSFVAK